MNVCYTIHIHLASTSLLREPHGVTQYSRKINTIARHLAWPRYVLPRVLCTLKCSCKATTNIILPCHTIYTLLPCVTNRTKHHQHLCHLWSHIYSATSHSANHILSSTAHTAKQCFTNFSSSSTPCDAITFQQHARLLLPLNPPWQHQHSQKPHCSVVRQPTAREGRAFQDMLRRQQWYSLSLCGLSLYLSSYSLSWSCLSMYSWSYLSMCSSWRRER